MKNLLRGWQYFRPDASRLAAVLGLLLLSTGTSLVKPWPMAVIVDSVIGQKYPPVWLMHLAGVSIRGGISPQHKATLLALLVAAIFLLQAVQAGLATAHAYLAIGIGLRGLKRVRDAVFNRLERLSFRFHQGANTGDIIHRAAWDTYAFQTLFQQGFISSVTAGVSLVLMSLVMWRLDRVLTLVALGTAPLLYAVMRFFGPRMSARGLAAQEADSRVTSLVQQGLAALALTQSNAREEDEARRFAEQTHAAQERRQSQHGWEVLYWLAIAVVFGLGTAGITWFGARQVGNGQISVGELLVFLAYLGQLYEPLNQLSHVGSTVATARAGARRVFELLDSPDEIADAPDARAITVRGEIIFDRVNFAYQTERPILREVSFQLAAGESAALIGTSGAGKTTLLNLIPRFFDGTSGSVKLEGVDVRRLRLKELRQQIALVPQEPVLVPGTIAENIAYARPGATEAEIKTAALAARADDFIQKLPQGYATVVGEGAARLSVGEKQRLNLARAFLKNAPILLLDEPTTGLDRENERLVVESLRELMRGRTTLIITHRKSTLRLVQKVLILNEGRLNPDAGTEDIERLTGGSAEKVAADGGSA